MKLKHTLFFLFLFLMLSILAGCGRNRIHRWAGNGLGTYYQITYIGTERKNLSREIDSLLRHYTHEFSIFDTTAALFRLNANHPLPLSRDFIVLLEKSLKISEMTHGAFDVTVEPLVTYWGFGRDTFSRRDAATVDSLRSFTGFRKIRVENGRVVKDDERIRLNFNAIAKGYIVDKVSEYLQDQGLEDFVVDIGGEVVCRGTKRGKPWQVGIQTPTEQKDGPMETLQSFPLRNQAVATSGNYRNYREEGGQRYTHIINPATGLPEKSPLLSVTVVAEECLTADALATAFMVMGVEQSKLFLAQNPRYAALFISATPSHEFLIEQIGNFPD